MYCSLPASFIPTSLNVDLRKSPRSENEDYRAFLSTLQKLNNNIPTPERTQRKEEILNVRKSKRIQPKNFQNRKKRHFENKKLCALIATFQGQCSYDRLYHDIPQLPPDDSLYYISVFSILYEDIPLLVHLLTKRDNNKFFYYSN